MACPESRTHATEVGATPAQRVRLRDGGGGWRELTLRAAGHGHYRLEDQGRTQSLWAQRLSDGGWLLIDEASGRVADLLLDRVGPRLSVHSATVDEQLERAEERRLTRALSSPQELPGSAGPLPIAAPMPGRVAKLLVGVGEAVAAGQAVAAVEAMKMENELYSPRAGRVAALLAAAGDHVEAGQALLVIA